MLRWGLETHMPAGWLASSPSSPLRHQVVDPMMQTTQHGQL